MKVKRPILLFFYVLYCVEAGIFLLLAPWSVLWIRTTFAQTAELGNLMMSGHVRGAISALGLLLIVIGMIDFAGLCRAVKEP